MKNFLSNQRSFTLLELIAVMLILGILAALAVPRYIDLEVAATVRAKEATHSPCREANLPSRTRDDGTELINKIDVEIVTFLFDTC